MRTEYMHGVQYVHAHDQKYPVPSTYIYLGYMDIGQLIAYHTYRHLPSTGMHDNDMLPATLHIHDLLPPRSATKRKGDHLGIHTKCK